MEARGNELTYSKYCRNLNSQPRIPDPSKQRGNKDIPLSATTTKKGEERIARNVAL